MANIKNPEKLQQLKDLHKDTLEMLITLKTLNSTEKIVLSMVSVSKELNSLIIKEIIGEQEDES